VQRGNIVTSHVAVIRDPVISANRKGNRLFEHLVLTTHHVQPPTLLLIYVLFGMSLNSPCFYIVSRHVLGPNIEYSDCGFLWHFSLPPWESRNTTLT